MVASNLTCMSATCQLILRMHTTVSRYVTAAMMVSQNNKTAAMSVYQSDPEGVELFFYVSTLFCSNKCAWLLATGVKNTLL